MKNSKACIIIPYFGRLHALFSIYLEGIKYNKSFDFLIVTDQQIVFRSIYNLKVINISFSEFQVFIKRKLYVNLSSPYKLCDLKPSYGFLFEEYLEDYDYWAYSDIDMLLGDLNIIYDNYLKSKSFDKVFDRGHLSFYRNIPDINEGFKNFYKSLSFHKYLFQSKRIWVFDETYSNGIRGINGLLIDKGYSVMFRRNAFVDVNSRYSEFCDFNSNSESIGFFYSRGCKLMFVEKSFGKVQEREIVYAHFPKRKVNVIVDGERIVYIPTHWQNCSSYRNALQHLMEIKKRGKNLGYIRYLKLRWFRNQWVLILDLFRYKVSWQILFDKIKCKIRGKACRIK